MSILFPSVPGGNPNLSRKPRPSMHLRPPCEKRVASENQRRLVSSSRASSTRTTTRGSCSPAATPDHVWGARMPRSSGIPGNPVPATDSWPSGRGFGGFPSGGRTAEPITTTSGAFTETSSSIWEHPPTQGACSRGRRNESDSNRSVRSR